MEYPNLVIIGENIQSQRCHCATKSNKYQQGLVDRDEYNQVLTDGRQI